MLWVRYQREAANYYGVVGAEWFFRLEYACIFNPNAHYDATRI
jgi:hypothetical protein